MNYHNSHGSSALNRLAIRHCDYHTCSRRKTHLNELERHAQFSQITIAGSFSELLQNVEALGSELIWMRGNEGYIQAPALLISALAVAGQEE